MIEILQDYDIDEILKKKEITKELLFEQIKGNILDGEIDTCIKNMENYSEFIKLYHILVHPLYLHNKPLS